ncbi:MAG TPA: methylenetetrahydrofolate reductase [Thermopolyspora sp.]
MSILRDRLESGAFAVTAEISPPRGADPGVIRGKVAPLRGLVDAVNITDNQSSFVRLSSWAGSLIALTEGVEPVMQVTCRDRNRIALQSDLISASALGIHNITIMTGDHPRHGDHADATPVFDLDSQELLRAARAMRDEHRLLSGREVDPAPEWFLGAVENPFGPGAAARLAKKADAGAQFVQTQFVFDVPAFETWMEQVRDLGLDERCHVIAGVGPIRSARALEHMSTNLPGVHIPDDIADRLRGASDIAEEGVRLCVDLIRRVREIPGVHGVHIMAIGYEHGIPDIVRRAGIR